MKHRGLNSDTFARYSRDVKAPYHGLHKCSATKYSKNTKKQQPIFVMENEDEDIWGLEEEVRAAEVMALDPAPRVVEDPAADVDASKKM